MRLDRNVRRSLILWGNWSRSQSSFWLIAEKHLKMAKETQKWLVWLSWQIIWKEKKECWRVWLNKDKTRNHLVWISMKCWGKSSSKGLWEGPKRYNWKSKSSFWRETCWWKEISSTIQQAVCSSLQLKRRRTMRNLWICLLNWKEWSNWVFLAVILQMDKLSYLCWTHKLQDFRNVTSYWLKNAKKWLSFLSFWHSARKQNTNFHTNLLWKTVTPSKKRSANTHSSKSMNNSWTNCSNPPQFQPSSSQRNTPSHNSKSVSPRFEIESEKHKKCTHDTFCI